MRKQISNKRLVYIKGLYQAGFNALELTLVLAVIAIAIVSVVRVMGSNTEKASANQMISNVGFMVMNVRNAHQMSSSGYKDLTTKEAINLKLVPHDLRIIGDTIKSQFPQGDIKIDSADNGDNFTITYNKVPSNVCVSVISTLGTSSFTKIKVKDREFAGYGTPINLKDLASACGKDEAVNIIFTAG